jgi:hypothetical protein
MEIMPDPWKFFGYLKGRIQEHYLHPELRAGGIYGGSR